MGVIPKPRGTVAIYLVVLKTAIVEALRAEFVTAINPDFRGENKPLISIEYPVDQSHYPGVWVQYADNAELSVAGIGHIEQSVNQVAHTVDTVTRWRFSGVVTLTAFALSSYERDRVYDELVASYVSAQGVKDYPLRVKIEHNDLIAMNANLDDLQPFGDQAAQGTPWGTDEVIYEKSLSFDVIGEFISRPTTRTLVPLSKVTYMKYVDGTVPPSDPPTVAPTPGDWDRTQWS